MQTIDFVNTAKWLVALYENETKGLIFKGRYRVADPDEKRQMSPQIVRAITDLAVGAQRIAAHPHAVEVLKAFGLEPIASRDYAIKVGEVLLGATERDSRGTLDDILRPLWSNWWILEECVEPLERLLIPSLVATQTDFDEVLTLELRYDAHDVAPKAETVADVLRAADSLYATVARSTGTDNFPPLAVIYADSGSSVRFDLRGLGEPIKQLKLFVVELWNRFRHRRADDYRSSADAFLAGLEVIGSLEALHSKGALAAEDVARYKHTLLELGIKLFESGALPREVPRIEPVLNQQILSEFQRKLLPASPSVSETEPPATKQAATRKSSKAAQRRGRRLTSR